MSGRSRRKKLQRAKRISQADSFLSPSSEAVTTNPLFSSDGTTSSTIQEADLDHLPSKSEKIERTETNKEKKEKETEGNENSSTIYEQLQPQPLIPCGPIEIKVDSLQKTVDSDESVIPTVLYKIKSNGEDVSENSESHLNKTNNSSDIVDSVNKVVESHDDGNDKPYNITLYPSTIKRVKSAGRITIAKSDTIIETREEGLEIGIEENDNYTSETNNCNIIVHRSAFNDKESEIFDLCKTEEEENPCNLNDNSNKCLGGIEVEAQFAYDKLANVSPNTDEPAHEQDTYLPFPYNNIHAEEESESSIHKDWNIIVEEDESEDDITKNEERDTFDADPVLIKVKSYNLPETSIVNLFNSGNTDTTDTDNSIDINENITEKGIYKFIDIPDALEELNACVTPEIIVADDYKEDIPHISSLIQLDVLETTANEVQKQLSPSNALKEPCFSQEICRKEPSQWPATDVAEMGDSTPIIKKEQQTRNNNPKWRKAAVKAVQLQESSKNFTKPYGNGSLPYISNENKNRIIDSLTTTNISAKDVPENIYSSDNTNVDLKDNTEQIVLPPIVFEGPAESPVQKSLSPPYSPPDEWKENSPSLQLSVISAGQYSPSSGDCDSCPLVQKANDVQLELPSSPRPLGSSHSSVLVDMGKVIGVLRSTRNQIPTALRANLENDSDDSNDSDNLINQNILNTEIETDGNRNTYSMPSATGAIDSNLSNSGGKCESCAADSSNTIQKRIGKAHPISRGGGLGSSDLDDSLCGDPLMYATFVAPVHQYSTETEPSRQASFNYPSRQPSFKQNSSDAEGGSVPAASGGSVDQQGIYSQFPGSLPVPGSRGKSRTPEKNYSKEVQDIYEAVPVEQWPLPPLPLGHQEIDAEDELHHKQGAQDCVQEVSHEELEQQAHLERMSFISVSSANEEEDDFEDNDQDVSSLGFPPLPPAPEFTLMQPKSRNTSQNHQTQHPQSHYHHIHQTILSMPPDNHISGGREATPMIHKSTLGIDDSNHRPTNQRNEMFPSWSSAGDIVECLPHHETFSSGTVRRKNKRERNRTNPEGNPSVMFYNPNNNKENSSKTGIIKSNTSLESASDMPDVTQHRIISDRKPLLANNIDSVGTKRSKSRSKSRSPTSSNTWIDDDLDIPPPPPPPHQVCHHHQSSLTQLSDHIHKHHQELSGSDGAAEIVIVHRGLNQPKCSLHPMKNGPNKRNQHGNRNASPDNISESSLSFHENEFANQANQHTSNIHTAPTSVKHKKAQENSNYSTPTSRITPHVINKGSSLERRRMVDSTDKYSNRDSVRESWATSSSSDRLTTINQGTGGGSDKITEVLSNYSHQSRLNDSVINANSSIPEKQFGDGSSSFLQKHHHPQQDASFAQQRHPYHHQKQYQTDCGTGGSSSSSSAAAVGAICSTPTSLSARSRKMPGQHFSMSHTISPGSGITRNTAPVQHVTYQSPQLQHQKSGGFSVHGYEAGMSNALRSSSRESGSSSSRATPRTGSREGGRGTVSTLANIAVTTKRVRNTLRNKIDRSIHTDQESSSSLPNAIDNEFGETESTYPTTLPNWMCLPLVAGSDCTELEAMAIPTSDTSSHNMKKEALLSNLHHRFKKDQIYTNTGTVLISVNPYKKLPLYTPDVIDIYRCHCLYALPPHIYAVTDRAWRALRDMRTDQCVLISGEAGSGKTESAKLTLQYLAAVTGHAKEFHNIKYKLLQSNPVLEAFGNAKTRINDNSSRFGKYMEVSFDFKGDPTGGFISNFLLEKSRVTRHLMGERNFHIFHQLLAGADIQMLKDLKLQRNPDNYVLLRCTSNTANSISSSAGISSRIPPISGGSGTGNSTSSSLTGSAPSNVHGEGGNVQHGHGIHGQGSSASSASTTTVASSSPSSSAASSTTASTATTAASTPQPNHRHGSTHHHTPHHHSEVIADRTDFHITKKALDDLDFSSEEIHDILKIISAILKLGNINFIPTTNMDGTEGCAISNDYELYDVCELLQGEFGSLKSGLTSRSIESKASDYLVTDLSSGEASSYRDVLCKTLYGRLFTWMINRINETIKVKTPRKHRSMGILDMYGFERARSSHEHNGDFEQLVINFANEKLQQMTTERTLAVEQQEYISEGIEWTDIGYVANAHIVGLIERGSYGILSILDEVCSISNFHQHSLLSHLYSNNLGEGRGSGSSTPSLASAGGLSSADEAFFDRLMERFGAGQNPFIEVSGGTGPITSSGTANTSTGSGAVQELDMDMQPTVECTSDTDPQKTPQQEQPTTNNSTNNQPQKIEVNEQDKSLPQYCFRIKHFIGAVSYDCREFVSRNRDLLDRNLSQAMFECHHPLLNILFPEGNPRRTTRRRPATTATQFKISLSALINNLNTKTLHYVRCIKPNDLKQPRIFNTSLVEHQLEYQGLVETTLLRRHGYVFRLEYECFLDRYKMLSTQTWPHWSGDGSVDGVTCLLRDLPISANEYAFGRTKIYIRTSKTMEILEEFRRERIDELATMIQKLWRGYFTRQKWNKLHKSQMVISTCWKQWKDKTHIDEMKQLRQEDAAAFVIQKALKKWQRRRYLLRLAHNLPSESPLCKDWPPSPRSLRDSNLLFRRLYHKWRCHRYRLRFDQISRNRMREKVTASLIFKDRKASYPRSIRYQFHGDYVNIRRHTTWKNTLRRNGLKKLDRHVVFADIVNKVHMSNGKFVPILFVISTSSMLIMDQRTMQIKYRIPASEIIRLSLSPYFDDIAVFHVKAASPSHEAKSQANIPGCLSSDGGNGGGISSAGMMRRKGDFVLQTGHVIEIVTKLFLVIQNVTGKPPNVNVATEFDANFGGDAIKFSFKKNTGSSSSSGNPSSGNTHAEHQHASNVKIVKKGNKMEISL